MFRSTRKNVFAALIAAAAVVSFTSGVRADTVSYVESANNATTVTTQYDPLGLSIGSISDPYGTETTTATAGGWILSFSPNDFSAAANNANGGMSQETDGKVAFTLNFSAPVEIQVALSEGGHYFTQGDADVSVSGGGLSASPADPIPNEITGSGQIATTFGTDNTWTGTANLGAFIGSYSSYSFSIDNDLFAEALASDGPASACISKDNFEIIITTGGGAPPSTPLPLASVGGIGLCAAVMGFRRKLAGLVSAA